MTSPMSSSDWYQRIADGLAYARPALPNAVHVQACRRYRINPDSPIWPILYALTLVTTAVCSVLIHGLWAFMLAPVGVAVQALIYLTSRRLARGQ